jgi:glycosyltransferase involved in cell wall biosynthesis
MKFSIIVPVYNTEKYIDKCLKSIKNQSYKDFEVIVVNDGTEDNALKIVEKYVKEDKRFKVFSKKNTGLSDTRNYGLKYVTGDYIVFVDSDDYIHKNLLLKINEECEKYKDLDIIKYQVTSFNDDTKLTRKIPGSEFHNVDPKDIFIKLAKDEMFEPAWLYAYKTKFWKKNKFKFAVGKLHEDFGLIPYIIIKAKKMSVIPFYGYTYLIRANSIITFKTREKNLQKANDVLYHYDNLMSLIDKEDIDYKFKQIFKSFLANEVIFKAKTLDGSDMDNYLNELRKRKVVKLLLDDTILRKIKKILMTLSMKLYIKKMMK